MMKRFALLPCGSSGDSSQQQLRGRVVLPIGAVRGGGEVGDRERDGGFVR